MNYTVATQWVNNLLLPIPNSRRTLVCSGQLIPDSRLAFSSDTADAKPRCIDGGVASYQILTDATLCCRQRGITSDWKPRCLQTSEQALHRRIVPTVTSAARTLLHPVAQQSLVECSACILSALVRVEQYTLGAAPLIVGHLQGGHREIRVRVSRHGPIRHSTTV